MNSDRRQFGIKSDWRMIRAWGVKPHRGDLLSSGRQSYDHEIDVPQHARLGGDPFRRRGRRNIHGKPASRAHLAFGFDQTDAIPEGLLGGQKPELRSSCAAFGCRDTGRRTVAEQDQPKPILRYSPRPSGSNCLVISAAASRGRFPATPSLSRVSLGRRQRYGAEIVTCLISTPMPTGE